MVQDDKGHPGEVWIRRKLFHITLGAFFIICMLTDDRFKWFFMAVLAFGIVLSFVQERKKLPIVTWFLDRYDKKGDLIPGQGPVAFFIGALFAWFIFGGDIAIACVIALSFGDPMAYIMGRSIKGPSLPWNKNKTVVGSLSFLISPFLIIMVIWGPVPAALISLSAALSESIPWPGGVFGDDNIMVPVVSSITAWTILEMLPVLL